ncbi:unnamed protein product [Parajaminaea phylloscopi]
MAAKTASPAPALTRSNYPSQHTLIANPFRATGLSRSFVAPTEHGEGLVLRLPRDFQPSTQNNPFTL